MNRDRNINSRSLQVVGQYLYIMQQKASRWEFKDHGGRRHQKLHWVLLSQATLLVSIPVSSIMTANKEMKQVVDSTAGRNSPVLTSKCETYDHFTPKEKEQIQ